MTWLAVACLVGAAGLAVGSRPRGSLVRLREAFGTAGAAPRSGVLTRTGPGLGSAVSTQGGVHRSHRSPVGEILRLGYARLGQVPGRSVLVPAVAGAGVLGLVVAGPVGGATGAAYGSVAAFVWRRRVVRSAAVRDRARALDGLSALAADLRAGLSPTEAFGASGSIVDRDLRLGRLAAAVREVAEQSGAPLAELVERVAAEARAVDRAAAVGAAQAAGARATALLLAALPLGGIALGYGIGADPLAVMLDTPLGAGCALGAIALQIAGLAWSDRLAHPPDPAP